MLLRSAEPFLACSLLACLRRNHLQGASETSSPRVDSERLAEHRRAVLEREGGVDCVNVMRVDAWPLGTNWPDPRPSTVAHFEQRWWSRSVMREGSGQVLKRIPVDEGRCYAVGLMSPFARCGNRGELCSVKVPWSVLDSCYPLPCSSSCPRAEARATRSARTVQPAPSRHRHRRPRPRVRDQSPPRRIFLLLNRPDRTHLISCRRLCTRPRQG
jgi:hypothetical protein